MNVSFDEGYYFNVNHEFDNEYWHYEDNRKDYQCIRPCHVNQWWEVEVGVSGKVVRRRCDRLEDALSARNSLRAMRNVK